MNHILHTEADIMPADCILRKVFDFGTISILSYAQHGPQTGGLYLVTLPKPEILDRDELHQLEQQFQIYKTDRSAGRLFHEHAYLSLFMTWEVAAIRRIPATFIPQMFKLGQGKDMDRNNSGAPRM